MKRFCKTQNIPTQKSATAKFARKKFVIDLSLLENITTNMTTKLPGIKEIKCNMIHFIFDNRLQKDYQKLLEEILFKFLQVIRNLNFN